MKKWNLDCSFDFNGSDIRYGRVGQGPSMVLIHGTPWSSFNLRYLIEGFSNTHTVYFYDLLGYGQSSKIKGDVSLAVQNEVLNQLLDHWGIEEPIVIGHDFGGAVALRTHLLNRRDFKKLILIDPVAISPWGSPFFSHVQKHESAFSGLPDYIHEAVVEAYVSTASFNSIDSEVLNAILNPWTGTEGKRAFYQQMAQADSAYTEEVQGLYHQIKPDTLILWGEQDQWIPKEQGVKLQKLIPNSRLRIIDNAGHLVIEEKPEVLIREIHHFLNLAQ